MPVEPPPSRTPLGHPRPEPRERDERSARMRQRLEALSQLMQATARRHPDDYTEEDEDDMEEEEEPLVFHAPYPGAWTARRSVGGRAPRRMLHARAARRSGPPPASYNPLHQAYPLEDGEEDEEQLIIMDDDDQEDDIDDADEPLLQVDNNHFVQAYTRLGLPIVRVSDISPQDQMHMRQQPPPVNLQQPPPCSFLRKGQRFMGVQKVASSTLRGKNQHWCVQVTIVDYNHVKGTINGMMEAFNVPDSPSPVVTYWEGEIVDNSNHTFFTAQSTWAATAGTDLRHWSRFKPFATLRREVLQHRGRSPSVSDCGHVFMRWKEQFFVNGSESRLTIAGFYYVSICRNTGEVNAYYYDPASSPDQQMKLSAVKGGEGGYGFPDYEVA